MLKHRLTFGPIFILALVGVFWLDYYVDSLVLPDGLAQLLGRSTAPSGIVLFFFLLAILPLAAIELTEILRANNIRSSKWLTILAAEIGLAVHYCPKNTLDGSAATAVVCTALVGVFVLALIFYSRGQKTEGVVAAAGGTMFAMIYLGLMLGFYLSIRRWHSIWVILAIIAITKACDTGAYFSGRAFGKHKLIPWLSPKKTWEGLVGGILASITLAVALAWWANSSADVGDGAALAFPYWKAVLAGVLFATVGHAGDLTASLFKRDAGIKDSSNILPGFGGILDVMDSPLLVAPVAYWLVVI